MTLRHIIALFAVAVMATGAQAAKPKKTKKAAKAQAEAVDTISTAEFSYAMGVANTNGLLPYLEQRMGIPAAYMPDFLQGFAQSELTPADMRQKARLAGIEMRQQVMTQGLQMVNRQIGDSTVCVSDSLFLQGFTDALAGRSPITVDSANIVTSHQLDYYRHAKAEREYGDNRRTGEAFLKANAKAKGVKVTASGLQYKVLTEGNGPVPTATQRVKVNYEGRLVDGTVFDSSYQRNQPATFAANQVIRGWAEALTMMPVGSKWELYIPQELGYGDRQSGKIPPLSALIFTVELLSIE